MQSANHNHAENKSSSMNGDASYASNNRKKRQREEEEDDDNSNREYEPKVMLITGGCGFIGSHVTKLMVNTYPDCKIIVMDKLSYSSSLKHLEEIVYDRRNIKEKEMKVSNSKNDDLDGCSNNSSKYDALSSESMRSRNAFTFIQGDISSADLVNHILKSEKVDTVLHFAAQTHVDNSFGNSFAFTETNVYGTHVLLEACYRLGNQIKLFMHVSTDEVYGESRETIPTGASLDDNISNASKSNGGSKDGKHHIQFVEDSPLEPTNPYAATKAAAEFIVKAYHRSFGLPVIITRSNNVYGEGQYPEKLIGKFCNQLLRKMPLTIHGKGQSMRSFLHVDDVSRAYESIMRKGKIGEVYNIGGTETLSVLDVAEEMLKLFGLEKEKEKHIQFVEDRKYNDMRYVICTEKLYALGWHEQVSWKEGIERTVNWYKEVKGEEYWQEVERALEAHPRLLGSSCM